MRTPSNQLTGVRGTSVFLLLLVGALLSASALGQTTSFGNFDGNVRTEWELDGRQMRLLNDFRYFEPDKTEWLAPKGSVINGASIPTFFWSFIGGPFEGLYRNASVVHDVACDQRKRPWKSVHRMFYFASRAGGLDALNAAIMYGAVYHFGPTWPAATRTSSVISLARAQELPPRLQTEDDFLRMREYIVRRKGDIKLEDIERLTSTFLKREVPVLPESARIRGLVKLPGI
jgi:hypothetical protein